MSVKPMHHLHSRATAVGPACISWRQYADALESDTIRHQVLVKSIYEEALSSPSERIPSVFVPGACGRLADARGFIDVRHSDCTAELPRHLGELSQMIRSRSG